MLVTSRSYEEYAAMFGLGATELSGRVLDCSAGAAGFAAVAGARGCRVVAVDPAYVMSPTELAEAGRADLERGNAIAAEHPDRFVWHWYGEPERRTQLRAHALARFLADRATNPGRYVAGALPRLPFRAGSFDIALCSHLLFTWADRLGLEWHRAALVELARVATQVRVFPTVLQATGDEVPFWDELITAVTREGLHARLEKVGYEFQRGADRMLVVSR